MPDTPGWLIRHAAAAACLVWTLCCAVVPARAQDPAPQPLAGPGDSPQFLSHYDFQLCAAALSIDDPRFSWDTHFGGAVDLVDYVYGRVSIVGDYEAVLGDQFRAFDPNQSYYTLEVSGSVWAGRTEIAGVFHHVSRHLSDRQKRFAIAWNVLGARVMRQVTTGGTVVSIRADLGRIVQHAWVDYQWTGDLDVAIRRPIRPQLAVFARGAGQLFGVDSTLGGRDTQHGGRVEGGIRIDGRAGALELFAAIEQRLDADPIERLPQHWTLAGFRLVNK